ncbi:nitrile hydratase subunit alpha [Rhodanobacter aciditrophus]|uniref:nitrile hydratase n=1 Tax=Rhodanobacter aciditrophus TaxID=1623218 RepID=A0ABW4B070_9GAMM
MSGTAPPSDLMLRIKAIETLLEEKNLIDTSAVDAMIELYENKLGPRNGAQVVAKAWTDEAYKARLLEDGSKAIAELGFTGVQGEEMVVLENTSEVHNVIVCTLCSCYPWPVLGLPPTWYKTAAYRSRVVLEPRAVLKEFDLEIPAEKEVRVWDSNAEIRFMVLPEQPEESKGLSEQELVEWVTRNSMIGTGLAEKPSK